MADLVQKYSLGKSILFNKKITWISKVVKIHQIWLIKKLAASYGFNAVNFWMALKNDIELDRISL